MVGTRPAFQTESENQCPQRLPNLSRWAHLHLEYRAGGDWTGKVFREELHQHQCRHIFEWILILGTFFLALTLSPKNGKTSTRIQQG
ncbi:hypothetical protein GBAR_LOCUS25048 [Geodia barretti]|uniref:Uncharacterized protein n=1 Tax=Geodia barretti TaxID=519541 RepID=A0AA35XBY3_GEOBA|nr:hypothetical protein GBAR_LOCUS25048 [Geodia barretti]